LKLSKDKQITRLLSHLRPLYIIAVAFAIGIIMIVSAVFELSQSKQELNQLMTEEASSLVETISMSSANTVMSNEEIEDLISQRLLSSARMTAYLDSIRALSQKDLETIAKENQVFRINIFDRNGDKVLSSLIPDSAHLNYPSKHEPKDFFGPILRGEKDEIIIGLKQARHEEGERFAVAVRRKSLKGGAIVVNVDASYLLEFRKKIGFGKMIQDLGDNSGIEYILLQDDKGIIAASKRVQEMSSVEGDKFLENAYNSDSAFTRETDFEGHKVFEVVKSLIVKGDKLGLIRLGLSMKQMDALEARMIRRGIVLSIVLFVITFIVLSTVLVSQNLAVVKKEYERVQTYSGNIIENMADALMTTDKTGSITIFNKNAELLFGKTQTEVLGKKFESVIGNKFQFLAESLREKGELNNIEVEYRDPEGFDKILLVSTTKTFDNAGELDSLTIVFRDITGVRNMEKQVQQHDKMVAMGELASSVAHEIRNPLNAISMVAQRYKKEFKPAGKAGEYNSMTDVLLSETNRVNNIIQQFLRFARPSKLNKTQIEVKDIVKDVSAMIEAQCRSKKLEFELKCNCEQKINVDKDLMKQALLNILQNSVDAVKKGKITLEVAKSRSGILFVISDTGPGIPQDKLDKIFNLYFTTKPSGTGMGLSIVQQIISQHNGTISVESETGKGTKFSIEIPVT
jgi:two-component system sensor histidine kinase HydH